MSTSKDGVKLPDDLVIVGHVLGAWGVQGWVRIKPYSADASAMQVVKTWWLDKPEMRDVDVRQVKMHGTDLVASLMGVADRNAAELLKGAVVKIARSRFPALADGEYYWTDLIGLQVENLQGENLGQVADMMENGAHPILRVASAALEDGKPGPERLIPFVGQFIKTVDLTARKISVDWGADF